jgi:hypothetical protein
MTDTPNSYARKREIMWFSFAAIAPIWAAVAYLIYGALDPSAYWIVPAMTAYCVLRALLIRRSARKNDPRG